MIIHICCSVDSWFFLGKIREKYPDEKLIGFFYNPNIHPESEYQTRLIDSRRSCEQLGIEWVEGQYDLEGWMAETKGLELAPEKGGRCAVCFDVRLFKTAQLAERLGHNTYTTTLLMSPKKDFSQLRTAAQKLSRRFAPRFIIEDFRKKGGTQAQFALARQKQAYKQNYCGCLYALRDQRAQQNRPPAELFCSIDPKTPGHLEHRLKLYQEREAQERAGQKPVIIEQNTLCWSLLEGGIFGLDGEVIGCSILPYSVGTYRFQTALVPITEEIAAIKRQPGIVITQAFADRSGGQSGSTRQALGLGMRDVTPIFVVERLPIGPVRVLLTSALWQERAGVLARFQ